MVHEEILVFSNSKLDFKKIETLYDKIFYDKDLEEYIIDAYSGVNKFYFEDSSKKVYFMQLHDLWQLSESEIQCNLSSPSYITVDEVFKENSDLIEVLTYARSLPESTWIGIMYIAP